MTTLLSALPVRISYRVNVRSDPVLARILDSERLKRTEVIVSMEVGKVRLDIGADLRGDIQTIIEPEYIKRGRALRLIPYLNEIRCSCK